METPALTLPGTDWPALPGRRWLSEVRKSHRPHGKPFQKGKEKLPQRARKGTIIFLRKCHVSSVETPQRSAACLPQDNEQAERTPWTDRNPQKCKDFHLSPRPRVSGSAQLELAHVEAHEPSDHAGKDPGAQGAHPGRRALSQPIRVLRSSKVPEELGRAPSAWRTGFRAV